MDNLWQDIKLLNDNYKKIVDYYFRDKSGKFMIDKNILIIDFDSWGIEKFYINNYQSAFYNIMYENFDKIYNIAICIQVGNWNTLKKLESYLNNFNHININIYFVLINEIATNENIDYLKSTYNNIVILSAENRGMDIVLFFINLLYIRNNKYIHDYIIKIHTKTNDEFRNNTLNRLISSHDNIIENIKLLSKSNIGMISGNIIYKYNEYKDAFRSNYYHLEKLIHYLYNDNIHQNYLEFSAGTMFIAKMKVFNILNIKNLEYLYSILNNVDTIDYYWYSIFYKMNINNKQQIYNDYINNKTHKYPNNISYNLKTGKSGLRDCMIEHAIERLFGYICKKNNYEII